MLLYRLHLSVDFSLQSASCRVEAFLLSNISISLVYQTSARKRSTTWSPPALSWLPECLFYCDNIEDGPLAEPLSNGCQNILQMATISCCSQTCFVRDTSAQLECHVPSLWIILNCVPVTPVVLSIFSCHTLLSQWMC